MEKTTETTRNEALDLLDSETFSAVEKRFIKLIIQSDFAGAKLLAISLNWMTQEGKNIHNTNKMPREYKEFESKLIDFGFLIPWGYVEQGRTPEEVKYVEERKRLMLSTLENSMND